MKSKVTNHSSGALGSGLIESPGLVGSIRLSLRGLLEDWRNPRVYATAPAEVDQLWGTRRYRGQVLSFSGYAVLIGVVYVASQAWTGAARVDGTVIPIDTSAFRTLPLPKLVPSPQPKASDVSDAESGGENGNFGENGLDAALAPAIDHAGGGGGGQQAETAATVGELPPFTRTRLTPPMPVALNLDPDLIAPPTLFSITGRELTLNLPTPPVIGVPFGVVDAPPSPGRGKLGGIGDDGQGGGIGPGEGPGFGPGCCGGAGGPPGDRVPGGKPGLPGPPGTGPGGPNGPSVVGRGVSAPVPTFRPNPTYSEPARKAKITGQVLLEVVVNEDGSVGDVKLVRGLGYELDESAIATVKTWKFRPGLADGKPVPVKVRMEVTFNLL